METPERIGRYPVSEELGRGGMGIVYRAHDTRLDRPVAIKMLSRDWAENHDQLARFQREARTLARFNHPNIATIYGLETDSDDRQLLILELVEGTSLAERLREEPLTVTEALTVARQVAAALAAAHRRGVIHRDLKPENVLLNLEGQVFVHGELWSASSSRPIQQGEKIRVIRVEGMRLLVEPSEQRLRRGAATSHQGRKHRTRETTHPTRRGKR